MNIPVKNLFNDLMQILNTRCYFGGIICPKCPPKDTSLLPPLCNTTPAERKGKRGEGRREKVEKEDKPLLY